MHRSVRILCLAGGVWLAYHFLAPHIPASSEALAGVGWRILPFLGVSLLLYWLDAWGWRLTLTEGVPPPLWRLFSIRMAGEAVNRITPLASLGGEPLKVHLLVRRGYPLEDGMASIVVAKFAMTLSQIAFILSGLALAKAYLPVGTGVLLGLASFPSAVLLLMSGVAALEGRRRRSHPEPGSVSEGRLAATLRGAGLLWDRIAGFSRRHPRAFAASGLSFLLGWMAGGLELMAGAHALGVPLSPVDAYVLETFIVSVNMAAFAIPAGVGAQEGGFTALGPAVGLTAAEGAGLALLRRCRELLWVAYGLGYLAVTEGRLLIRPRVDSAASD